MMRGEMTKRRRAAHDVVVVVILIRPLTLAVSLYHRMITTESDMVQ
jgi:hypothetical protein